MTAKRPFALFERGMYLDGQRPVAFVLPATLAGTLDEAHLRVALDRVQARHAVLQCLVEQGSDGRPWFVQQATPPPIAVRIVERQSDDDWQEQARFECERLFDGRLEPLVRLVWLRGDGRSDVLLSCHHCICDGLSAVGLLQDILTVCGRPEAKLGRRFALYSGADVVPPEAQGDRWLQRRARWKAALFTWLIRLQRIGPPLSYGPVYTLRWSIEPATVQALVRRSKDEGVGMFAALCTAFMLACWSVRGVRGVDKFVAPVDARRYLPALQGGALFTMAPTVRLSFGSRKAKAGSADFWTLARALHEDMRRKIDRLAPTVYEQLLGLEQLHPLFDRLVAYSRSRRSGRSVSLSYLGRLDAPAQNYGSFRLEAIHAPSALLEPTPANLITIAGFAEGLDIAFISDESSLSRTQAEQIRQLAMELLQAAATLPASIASGTGAAIPLPAESL
ncbi:Condensation domain-containing protein [Dyella sp. OK004]|uniref:condensation domain-containing protein n=1 Tax=Dyella sp. OK004 TaxID=1855292 RepID=UPI0008E02289|nr:condensation domain-containing protein [Dyella sp. OK004]SFR90450.1 Condensation domain-containing protein [Dyella sp. OK004]